MFEWLWYLVIIFTLASLIPACYSDLKTRKVPVWIWYPGVYVGIPLSIILFVIKIFSWEIPIDHVYIYVGTALVLVIISLAAGYLNVFGGADAIALCLVALTAFYYSDPVNMAHPLFVFLFLKNFVICAALIVVGVFVMNLAKNNNKYIKSPLFLFFTTMVSPKELQGKHLLVMEDVREIDGNIVKRFVEPSRLTEGTDYYKSSTITKDPDRWSLYKQLDMVLVMYIVPMIIPITAAYIITILFGDITHPLNIALGINLT